MSENRMYPVGSFYTVSLCIVTVANNLEDSRCRTLRNNGAYMRVFDSASAPGVPVQNNETLLAKSIFFRNLLKSHE